MRLIFARAVSIAVFMAVVLLAACEQPPPEVEEAQPRQVTATMPLPTATAAIADEATATPEPTPQPTITATYTATPTPDPIPAAVPAAEDPPVRDLFALAQRYGRADADGGPLTRTLPPDPDCCEVGHRKEFFVTDLIQRRTYMVDAELLAVSKNAYWYADVETDTDGVRSSSRRRMCSSRRSGRR